MEPINRRTKCWRMESTPDRKTASAMWRVAKSLGIPVRGWMDGGQCRVQMWCTEWTAWRVVTQAHIKLRDEAKSAPTKDATSKSPKTTEEPKESAGDAGYGDDSWSQDEPLTDEYGRYFDSGNLPYVLAIYDEARRAGFEAQWRRVDYTSQQWRVTVWEVSPSQFSDLLEAGSQTMAVAA